MNVVRHRTARELLTAAAAFFDATEEVNHLILAVAESVTRRGGDDAAFFASVWSGSDVVAVALQTPPWPMQVSALADVTPLVAALDRRPPAVSAPPATAHALAGALGGGTLRTHLRSHVLTAVTAAARTAGTLRPAREEDRPTLIEWFRDYLIDVDSPQRALFESAAERGLREGITYLWETDRPVAMATISGRTPHGRRVGDVFTPRPLRGRGYAEALTAAISQLILDEGCRWCFLFTDVANPTSNAIYRRVGYVPNGDLHEIALTSG